MSGSPQYFWEHEHQLVQAWAAELAVMLGRPAAAIVAHGLGAGDFRPLALRLGFDDGSEATYRYAFAVRSETKRATAIFTEHCGYFVVPATTTVKVITIDVETAETPALDDD